MTDMGRLPGSLAEQFSTFIEYAASTTDAPQAISTTLEAARHHGFTGEITVATQPIVRLYLDGGVVYLAERVGDASISQLLRDAGIVKPGQLERGIVRVGDVEHLGRLFDRDPSIDRDAVMVMVETRTDAVVEALANRVIAAVQASSYRHHPSGVHRWFVGANAVRGCSRPVTGVAQVDTSVVDDLPVLQPGGTPLAPPVDGLPTPPAPVVTLSSAPAPSTPPPPPPVGTAATELQPRAVAPTSSVADAIQDELDTFDADQEDWSATSGGQLRDFRIVWPDGTEDDALAAPANVPDRADGPTSAPRPTRELSATAVVEPEPVLAPDPATELAAPVFNLEPLVVESIPAPEAAIPDDISSAVRRALLAIENASVNRADIAGMDLASVGQAAASFDEPRQTTEPVIVLPAPGVPIVESARDRRPGVGQPTQTPPPDRAVIGIESGQRSGPESGHAPTPLGFAPPTSDMRAEVVYARVIAEAEAQAEAEARLDRAAGLGDPLMARSADQRGRASVVFVDEEADADAGETAQRRGALRRLISSLRQKDE